VLRRVRGNGATAQAARVDAAIAARDADALPTLFAADLRVVDHATGVDFDREGVLVTWRVLLRAGSSAGRSMLAPTSRWRSP
jgi:hypothetical protein